MAVLGIDLGGTNVKGIVMSPNGDVLHQEYVPTTDDGKGKWRANVKLLVDKLITSTSEKITGIGLSAPGLPNEENTAIAFLPNRLNGLENFIWGDYLDLPTKVINDAHSATMAEYASGAAKDFKTFVLLTLGTGVGGGLVIDGKLHQGLSQMAGHLGHLSINHFDDNRSLLGAPGSLEYAMGNYSILERSFGKFQSTRELLTAYESGDEFAQYIWLSSVKSLSVAICSLINALSPEAVVLAGGITLAGDSLYKPLHKFLDIFEFRPAGKTTQILQAKYSEMSGSIGAASYALKHI